MIRSSKKTLAKRRKIKELDSQCRAEVFARDNNSCVKCGRSQGKLDWAHCITRRDITLRHDPDNSMVLCFQCHKNWHENPLESTKWFELTFPLRYEYLMECRRTIAKVKAII